jgi:hypothetical protein
MAKEVLNASDIQMDSRSGDEPLRGLKHYEPLARLPG